MSGEPTRAARLFGAAAALSESVAVPPPPGTRMTSARGLAVAQGRLGREAFARAWSEGRALPLEQALYEAEKVVVPEAFDHDETTLAQSEAAASLPRQVQNSKQLAGHLTHRQTEVLRLVAEGKTDRQIATDMVLSEKTVGRHLENIFARLGVSSRSAATAVAVRLGLA